MKKIEFELLREEAAYLIWYIFNDCHIRIETIMAIEKNLELVVSNDGIVMAYRYDHPSDMVNLVLNDGKWNLTNHGRALSKSDKHRLELICRDYSHN
jgi:hypothetical protein